MRAIPALLKIRFGTNEILTSLMLVYVAQLFARLAGARALAQSGRATTFPTAGAFTDGQILPVIFGDGVRLSVVFVLIAVVVAWFVLRRTLTGFQIAVLGQAPRAGGLRRLQPATAWFCMTFLISGGLAGLAGICEVAGPIGQLRTSVSPGLRLHRDHRRLPRPAQSDRHPLRRPAAGALLSGRRGRRRSRSASPTRSRGSSRACCSSSSSPATRSSSTAFAWCDRRRRRRRRCEVTHGHA